MITHLATLRGCQWPNFGPFVIFWYVNTALILNERNLHFSQITSIKGYTTRNCLQNSYDYAINCCHFLYGDCFNWLFRVYPIETHLNPQSHRITFGHNLLVNCPVISHFRTEHGGETTGQLIWNWWTNGISWDLSLMRICDQRVLLTDMCM